jgi:2-hydroxy-6-oxonona-2,4-dienedioate hydrolase
MYRCPMYKFSQESFKASQTRALDYSLHCLYADVIGAEKLPLVMVHGALVSRRYLMPTAELLAGHLHVYVPDLAGHGNSTKVERALSVEEQARVLHAWMINSGFAKVNLLGHSYGSQIVGEFAAKYPDMINKLVLASPAADPNVKSLLENFLRLTADGILENPMMPFILLRDLWDMGIGTAFETAHEMMIYRLRDALPLIKARTLVIRGSRDFLVSQKWVEEIAATIADARLDVISDGPHNINFSTPEDFAPALLQFLE